MRQHAVTDLSGRAEEVCAWCEDQAREVFVLDRTPTDLERSLPADRPRTGTLYAALDHQALPL